MLLFSAAFWLCLFARAGAVPDLLTLLWLGWELSSVISWFSPFPFVFFLLETIFLRLESCSLFLPFCCCVSCCVVSVVLSGVFVAFCFASFALYA